MVPDPQSIDITPTIHIPRKRYILLLDDLDKYLANSATTGIGPLQLIYQLRVQALDLIVIATVRKTGPEFDAVASTEYLLDRWCHIEIRDWPDKQGAKLAKKSGPILMYGMARHFQ